MYLSEILGCTLDELGDRMSSEEYTIRQYFYYNKPVGVRQLSVLVANLLEMFYSVHKRTDSAPRSTSSWLNPELLEVPEPKAPSTVKDLEGFIGG